MDKEDATLRRIAYHEAGHAVIAACCGFPVTGATIIPADGLEGHVVYLSTQADREARDNCEDIAVWRFSLVSLGGLAGEYCFLRDTGSAGWGDGHHGDREEALTYLRRCGEARQYPAVQMATVMILEAKGRATILRELADALLLFGTMPTEVLDRICDRVAPLDEADVAEIKLAIERASEAN